MRLKHDVVLSGFQHTRFLRRSMHSYKSTSLKNCAPRYRMCHSSGWMVPRMQTGIFFIPRNIYKDFIDRTCQWVSFVNSEVRCFTGLANYYRRFVEGYAEMAAPRRLASQRRASHGPRTHRRASTRLSSPSRRLTTDASNILSQRS